MLREERHGVDSVVQVVIGHGAGFEAGGVHIGAGGIVEEGAELSEPLTDGELIIAEEEGYVGGWHLKTKV